MPSPSIASLAMKTSRSRASRSDSIGAGRIGMYVVVVPVGEDLVEIVIWVSDRSTSSAVEAIDAGSRE